MLKQVRGRLTYANVMSSFAVFVALGGGAYALTIPANSVGTRQLKNKAVTGKKIKRNAVTSSKVKNFSLLLRDFKAGQLPAGPRGLAGATGQQGPAGRQGPAGQDGSPDTPGQILSKLQTVDGSGSGLDADTVDGLSSNAFVPLVTASAGLPAVPVNFYSYFMTTTTTTRFDFGQMALEAAGTAGQFKICGDTGSPSLFNWVLYLNGTRSTGTVAGNACTTAFDAGAEGDFQVMMRRSMVFGVHSGDSTTNENYNIYGFGQL